LLSRKEGKRRRIITAVNAGIFAKYASDQRYLQGERTLGDRLRPPRNNNKFGRKRGHVTYWGKDSGNGEAGSQGLGETLHLFRRRASFQRRARGRYGRNEKNAGLRCFALEGGALLSEEVSSAKNDKRGTQVTAY